MVEVVVLNRKYACLSPAVYSNANTFGVLLSAMAGNITFNHANIQDAILGTTSTGSLVGGWSV